MIIDSNIQSHIEYLRFRAAVLSHLYEQFLNMGATPKMTISQALALVGRNDPDYGAALCETLESLPFIDARLGISSTYTLHFKHGQSEIDDQAIFYPLMKLYSHQKRSSHFCAIAGNHMIDEPKSLADERARAIQIFMQTNLPSNTTIDIDIHIDKHACDWRCAQDSTIGLTAHVFIAEKLDQIPLSQIINAAESTNQAANSYEKSHQTKL